MPLLLGTAPNQVPTNGDLGTAAFINIEQILGATQKVTTAQKNAIPTPPAGLIVFDTTLAKLCVYSGAAWETITSA